MNTITESELLVVNGGTLAYDIGYALGVGAAWALVLGGVNINPAPLYMKVGMALI